MKDSSLYTVFHHCVGVGGLDLMILYVQYYTPACCQNVMYLFYSSVLKYLVQDIWQPSMTSGRTF